MLLWINSMDLEPTEFFVNSQALKMENHKEHSCMTAAQAAGKRLPSRVNRMRRSYWHYGLIVNNFIWKYGIENKITDKTSLRMLSIHRKCRVSNNACSKSFSSTRMSKILSSRKYSGGNTLWQCDSSVPTNNETACIIIGPPLHASCWEPKCLLSSQSIIDTSLES